MDCESVEASHETVEPATTTSISLAGCGFLGIYHVGVASCLKEYAPHLISGKVCGASAGALVSVALIAGCSIGDCTSFVMNLATEARSRVLGPLDPNFDMNQYIRDAFNRMIPADAYKTASGRLHVSLTRVSDGKNVTVSQFDNNEELSDALVCSCFVPLYSGIIPPTYRGTRYVDGGFSDNIPLVDATTITVSPFAGESDICPNDNSSSLHYISMSGSSFQVSANNLYRFSIALFPPTPDVLKNLLQQGYNDTLRYLKKKQNNRLSTTHQQPV